MGPPTAPVAWAQVAVDAAGAGGDRTYTYHLSDATIDVGPGEAVLVDFGRRRALGVVLAVVADDPGVPTKPIVSRVRADGPILPRLSLALAASIAETYLAPPAATIRAMLPPRTLERVELIVERVPEAGPAGSGAATARAVPPDDPWTRDVLEGLEAGPRPARDLLGGEGRAAGLRRLHDLEARGLVHLAWELRAAGAGPRYDRWLRLTEAGRAAAAAAAKGASAPGGRLGPRQAAAVGDLAADPDGAPAARIAASHGAGVPAALVRRGLAEADVRERPRRPLDARPVGARGGRPAGADLSVEQAAAVAVVGAAIAARDARPLLVDGVTGGGRTAVYVESIALSLAAGRPALVLVPEIALATPLLDRIRADLDAEVAVLHSALGEGERTDEWRRIRAGAVDVVVGTRIAVAAPLADVGLVVVDEEHDPAYKSDRMPRLQARDVAIRLGVLAGAAVVLGSATPAVETYGRALDGTYGRISLPARLAGAAPAVEVVDLREELAGGNRGLLSRRLTEELATLDTAAGERAILVMNRRGAASVVLCRDCGRVEACPDCDRPLVYHEAAAVLRCHHCGASAPVPARCRACGSARVRYLGGGTERIEREVAEQFPGLRVGRLDRDVVERRGEAVRVVDAFAEGRLDVLVGTSLVTKGLDVPEVTLVGVVSADVALNLPDERAAERTLQLVVQAIGRAGRGERPGRAIVQTYLPGHPVMRAVATGDIASFYASELAVRRLVGSPPFGRLVKLTVALAEREAARRAAEELAATLRDRALARGSATAVIGPAPAYVARRAGRWRWNIALRGADPVGLLGGAPPSPWVVDVDPESLL
ncbi:MAG: primosomal protein N' [Chloroflexi bacterium]|jgi:primosomal protein N' (replication factor Y)|nr:primosomal protein N' [Chloroflexota bacterium]